MRNIEQRLSSKHEKIPKTEIGNVETISDVRETEKTTLQKHKSRLQRLWGKITRSTLGRALFLTGMIEMAGCATTAVFEKPVIEQVTKAEAADEEKERKELIENIQKYRAEVALYKGLGFETKAYGVFFDAQGRKYGWENIILDKLLTKTDKDIEAVDAVHPYYRENPLDFVEELGVQKKEIAPELQNPQDKQAKKMDFPVYEITADHNKEKDELNFKIINWFDAHNPIVFEKTLKNMPEQMGNGDVAEAIIEKEIQELADIIKKQIEQKHPQKYIDEIEPDTERAKNHQYTIDIDWRTELSQEQIRALEQLAKTYKTSIKAVPLHGNIDRTMDMPFAQETIRDLAHPIIIRGELQRIALEKIDEEKVVIQDKEAGTVNGEKIFRLIIDKFGNQTKAFKLLYENSRNGKTAINNMHIEPPIPFSKKQELKTLNIEIPSKEPIQLNGIIEQKTFPILDKIPIEGEEEKYYELYSNMPEGVFEFKKDFAQIAEGISHGHNIFGLDSADTVQKIMIANAKWKNAHFDWRNPDTITIQDEMFKKNKENSREIFRTAFHETMHAIDAKYGISENFALTNIYNYVKKYFEEDKTADNFFNFINEKSFSKDEGISGGHSHDNKREFFASLVNTLNNKDWQKKFETEEGKKFATEYLQSLRALQISIESIPEIKKGAPVFALIEERIEYLESKLEKKP